MSWSFTLEKINARIDEVGKAVVRDRRSIAPLSITRGTQLYGPAWDAEASGSIGVGETYEAVEETVTLGCSLAIPAEWSGGRVYLALEIGGAETLAYLDGKPAQAIDGYHHELLLADPAEGGRAHDLKLAAYTGTVDALIQGGWSGSGNAEHTEDRVKAILRVAELQLIDRGAEALFHDLHVALESAKTMDANSREHVVIVNVLDAAVDLLDFRRGAADDMFYASIERALSHVRESLYDKYHADPDFAPTLWCTGHAHIDTAWLWRLAHTHQKIARTFANAVALMDQYPEYRFSASQPQQYAYLKQDYPDVYARVKAAVARGQWEPVGGMWVECDCNVVSGESLVRQFLYGNRFFEREFGKRTKVVWLPDVFGYSAAFPQIIRKAGMKYFMTIKIYWNEVNKPPYQTFEWEGIDGTTVLTHFSPLGDYNAHMTPEQWRRNWDEYKQKHLGDSALYIYGWGDGGGGPTRQMIERGLRARDFPGMPKVKFETNEAFFDDLERQVAGKRNLPRWVGELYLEHHRGTYTAQGRNKQLNRHSEILLQTAEQLACIAQLRTGASYPLAELTTAWEKTLLNQFHDILPGSSIHAVYDDSARDYEEVVGAGAEAADAALRAIARAIDAESGEVLLANPLSWDRSDIAVLPRGANVAGQNVVDFDGTVLTVARLCDLPATGYALASKQPPAAPENLSATVNRLENRFFIVTLDANGEIESVVDKRAGREVIDRDAYCKGNALLLFEDKPINSDAWNIDIFYQDKMEPLTALDSITVVETGPIRATVEIVRGFGSGSKIAQRISVYADLDRIDIATDVWWQERQRVLKAAFPVTVHSPRATYDIQFGNVERPTHWNTSWDWARFEVCGQKWADLSEGDYGVSILSDSKYGWDIKGNVMRLTLLTGSINPDADADRGRHRFAYSLYPHAGDWRAARTVRRAYEFNVPVRYAVVDRGEGSRRALASSFSLVSTDSPNLVVETVKKAEDEDALIVRFHEAHGQRGRAKLKFGVPIDSAIEVNLMEEIDSTLSTDLSTAGDAVTLSYGPYDIRTIKVTAAPDRPDCAIG